MIELNLIEKVRAYAALHDALNLDDEGPRPAGLRAYFERLIFAEDPVGLAHAMSAATQVADALFDAGVDAEREPWAVSAADVKKVLTADGLGGYVAEALGLLGAKQDDAQLKIWRTSAKAPEVRLQAE